VMVEEVDAAESKEQEINQPPQTPPTEGGTGE